MLIRMPFRCPLMETTTVPAEPPKTTAAPSEAEPRKFDSHYANRVLVLFAGIVAVSLYVEGMLLPSLPSIASTFNVTIAQVSLVIAMYTVSGMALTPIIGKFGDVYGKKRILTYVLVLYAAAVTVTGFSPNFTFMLAARTVQGISLAIQPLLISMVREEFPKERVPSAQGVLSGMFGVGFAVSIPLGAFISNDFGWRATYHTAVPFVLLVAALTFVLVKESPNRRPGVKIDYVGAALLGAPLAMIVLALAEGSSWGWTSAPTILLISAGAVILVPLVLYERVYSRRGGEPILDLQLLSARNVMVANLAILFGVLAMIFAFQAYIYKFELPAPVGDGLSIFTTGLSLVPLAISLIIFSPLAGVLVSKTGVKRLAIPGAFVGALGFYLNAISTTYVEQLACMFVVGAGISIVLTCTINLLVLTVDMKKMGLANSMNNVFKNLGSSLGAPLAASLLSTFTVSVVVGSQAGKAIYQTLPSAAAFQYAFYLAAGVFLATALVVVFAHEVLGPGREKVDVRERMRLADAQ
jgi:MFS family permease